MAQVALQKVNKSFGPVHVIKDVDLSIEPGEFVVFVGPSGCGKSTLLRLIAGLESLSTGIIQIGDRAVMDLPPSKRGIAMVFQSYALSHRTQHGFRIAAAQGRTERVQKAAEILQMEHLLDRAPLRCRGQRQRGQYRALVRILMCSCLMSLIQSGCCPRHETRAEIAKLHKQLGATTIYVTHDQVEAMTLADKIVVLKDGEVMQVGAPMDLFHKPANEFVAGFLAPQNELIGGALEGNL